VDIFINTNVDKIHGIGMGADYGKKPEEIRQLLLV